MKIKIKYIQKSNGEVTGALLDEFEGTEDELESVLKRVVFEMQIEPQKIIIKKQEENGK